MEKDFEEMSPLEHLEAAKELLETVQDACKDLQELLDEFKPAV